MTIMSSGFSPVLYAGLIAVPLFAPESARERHLGRVRAVALDAQPRCILATHGVRALLESTDFLLEGVRVIEVDALAPEGAEQWRERVPRDSDTAFLQYTSGSTSAPKGVVISHANLMANERAIEARMSISAEDRFVSWLPLYHDMGLVGGLLQPLHRGIPLVLATPQYFLEAPVRWLRLISQHRATISGGPDFAFRLCVERVTDSQRQELDLSSWRVAFCGAEPVRPDTLGAFAEGFASVGFDSKALYPCYGLAEGTLLVSGAARGTGLAATRFNSESLAHGHVRPSDAGTVLVGCGTVPPHHRADIVAPESGARLPAGSIGEIWVSGPSISGGYWQREAETAASFVERRGRRWLRTGDLGFRHAGQLYIAGRQKDLIIVRGQNLYPQDIERAIEGEVEAVRKGRVAAFSVPTPHGEGIGVAFEVSRGLQKLVAADTLVSVMSSTLSAACGEPLSVAVLLNPGALPKTSSGKLQRIACREGWQQRSLDAFAIYEHGQFVLGGAAKTLLPAAPRDDIERAVAQIWQSVLRCDTPGPESSFFAGGGNSLSAAQVVARISSRWEIGFPVRAIFERPTLANIAGEIKTLLRAGSRRRSPPVTALSAEQRAQPLPLSFAQQRLWFLCQLDPTNTAYHICGRFRFSGQMNVAALRDSFEAIVNRHESLRTVFRAVGEGEVRQIVLPTLAADVVSIDLTGPEDDAHLAAELQRIQEMPFDLSAGPLLRVGAIQVANAQWLLVIAIHHIVSDGWSMQLMLHEFSTDYAARVAGRAIPVEAPPVQYVDYAAWQRHYLDGGERERQLAWWRARLGTEQPVLELPVDHPRGAATAYRPGRHELALPADLLADLRHRADKQGTTLFATLLAAFQIVLYRYSGQQDVRVGVPVANRNQLASECIVGFFVNALVLRNCIDDGQTLAQVLQQATEAAQGAQAHQDLPFDQLVEALHPGRDLSHSPLFRVVMNHQWVDDSPLRQLPGLRLEEYSVGKQAAQFELALDTVESPHGGLQIRITYAADLFEPDTVERFAGHYTRVLEQLARQPERYIREIKLVQEPASPPDAREHLSRFSECVPIHRLIEQQAVRIPESVAVVCNDEKLRYAELNARANRLAHRLIDLGVHPETRVGIALERSIEMVVAVLAVLKAGGAYVPLDPAYPIERLRYMMRDSGITLLLRDAGVAGSLPALEAVVTLALDDVDLSAEPAGNPDVPVCAQHLAYVIYTSGSTGKSKGALLCHGNVGRLLEATRDWFHFGDQDVWTLFHSYAFDFSVWEIFGALCYGGQLVIVPQEVRRSPEEFLSLLRQRRVTVLNQTPSAFRQLLQVPALYECEDLCLRAVIFGGEALDAKSLRPWIEHFGDSAPRLINMYGITETTVHVTYRPITRADLANSCSPIGESIADLKLHVLDSSLNAQPAGVAGELYVSGAGLARGYLNRAALTAERFIADPFSRVGERLYRTGDQVRRRADGQLDYLGRLDRQVKIRGFRIELGEIEAQLLTQPQVRDAVVIARNEEGGNRLLAYVVPSSEALQAVDAQQVAPRGDLVTQWESVFDSAYVSDGIAPGFRGWNSSYTDLPISDVQMQEWLECTVRRIAALNPDRILEIGCGVGLLIQRLAPGASVYRATDLSTRAVRDLRGVARHAARAFSCRSATTGGRRFPRTRSGRLRYCGVEFRRAVFPRCRLPVGGASGRGPGSRAARADLLRGPPASGTPADVPSVGGTGEGVWDGHDRPAQEPRPQGHRTRQRARARSSIPSPRCWPAWNGDRSHSFEARLRRQRAHPLSLRRGAADPRRRRAGARVFR